MNEFGIIPADGGYTKDSKYGYKIIEAIKNKDLMKLHGDLGVNAKLDYNCGSSLMIASNPDSTKINPLALAIHHLEEPDLIKLININTQLDVSKSIFLILTCLSLSKKASSAVFDALIAKLPENSEHREFLEEYKNCLHYHLRLLKSAYSQR